MLHPAAAQFETDNGYYISYTRSVTAQRSYDARCRNNAMEQKMFPPNFYGKLALFSSLFWTTIFSEGSS
jgi:hypothetical protein